jgi:hypothetical protein
MGAHRCLLLEIARDPQVIQWARGRGGDDTWYHRSSTR